MKEKVYAKIDQLPRGKASQNITEGCLVLEGGAFRGLYTQGVLDALMEANINMQCVIGVSAGAMSGLGYLPGQIGRSARINLRNRHNSAYVGIEAYKNNGGIIGFDFVLDKVNDVDPIDLEALRDERRRFVTVATNCKTGKPTYFEKGKVNLNKAIQASASMPYVSQMVYVDGEPYLDGGCSDHIPYKWALKEGYENIIVVKTRTHAYRKDLTDRHPLYTRFAYRHYPAFANTLIQSDAAYNVDLDQLDRLEEEGRVFVFIPSKDLGVSRVEGDMDKLGEMYYLGLFDAKRRIDELKAYLQRKEK